MFSLKRSDMKRSVLGNSRAVFPVLLHPELGSIPSAAKGQDGVMLAGNDSAAFIQGCGCNIDGTVF